MIDQTHRWRDLGSRLGFRVVAPVALDLEGESVSFTALLPDFGGAQGMIAEPDGEFLSHYWDALTRRGYGFSCVELGADDDDDSACEMLRDWGWASTDPEPDWW